MSEGRSLYVPLSGQVADALVDLALREYRHPRAQATKLLVEALERAGALPSEQNNATDPGPTAALEAVT